MTVESSAKVPRPHPPLPAVSRANITNHHKLPGLGRVIGHDVYEAMKLSAEEMALLLFEFVFRTSLRARLAVCLSIPQQLRER